MKETLVSVGVLAALVMGFLGLVKPAQIENQIGAQAQSVVDGECFSLNGSLSCPNKKVFTQATTTVCAIKSPSATSTLLAAGAVFTTSSTTASLVTFARATTAFATTTLIGTKYNIGANAQASINASTSPAAGAAEVFPPNTYFVVGMEGNIGTFSPVGKCYAEFIAY